jgi:hypothetical protein
MRTHSPQSILTITCTHMVSDKGLCLQYVSGKPQGTS